ncbi:hypothetical protein E2562_016053 [Oryza meyeriana var. granulata]|uniref:DUF4219 domain-containing protein n=1 Tax=Oryza meyeriana var. granulata TaxID=110450 RepID=A0A6G1BLF5_9ORYZ|nr:hypothetical protein E2562_016053 [Oryza meyeriana var. granulata]
MKTMPRDDSSPSKAIVSGSFGGLTTTATAMTGRLPFPMLTRTNYMAWAMRMKFLLRTNGAWGAIDLEKASRAIDESKDQLALTIISQSIDDKMLLRVAEKETASDVWAALRSMHSMDDFVVKFTVLVGRIREIGDAMDEKYVVRKLLQVVSTKFVNVTSSLMLFSDINKMAMEEAIGSLKAHEELLKGQEVQREEQQLLMARARDLSGGRGRGRDEQKDKSKGWQQGPEPDDHTALATADSPSTALHLLYGIKTFEILGESMSNDFISVVELNIDLFSIVW